MPTGLGKLYSVAVAVASGGSATVNMNGTYARVFVQMVNPGAAVDAQASLDGTNYSALRFGHLTATSGVISFLSTHSNLIREIPAGYQYYKFINTTATGAGEAIRVWGSDV